MTVVLTTHYLDEAEHLADRVGVMSAGRLIVEGTPADLQRRSGRTLVSFRCGGGEDELAAATRLAETLGNRVRLVDGRIELLTAEVTAALHALTSWAVEQRVDIDSWSVAQPSLEQVFLDLVGGAEGE